MITVKKLTIKLLFQRYVYMYFKTKSSKEFFKTLDLFPNSTI